MKLDINCIRTTLIALESHLQFNDRLIIQSINFDDFCSLKELSVFSKETILYTAQMLDEAGLIHFSTLYADCSLYDAKYNSITYEGHQFLENIRSEEVFSKTKDVLSKVGSFSLNVISDVAAKVIVGIVNQKLRIN